MMVKPTPDPPKILLFNLPVDHPLNASPRLEFDPDNKEPAQRYAVYHAKPDAERHSPGCGIDGCFGGAFFNARRFGLLPHKALKMYLQYTQGKQPPSTRMRHDATNVGASLACE
ncbi:hypothetical protein [Pseudomonas abieticivorans]|uniref:hypothetical protein n=1 Tax=Pseudomonas abieticivorans TaxID=2931382 RepID=UPI0020C02E27|nr:hypothetical protein [Pseudomonas sp. PIA16]